MPSSYTLGTHFENFVKHQIISGRYNNASEVIRSALRLMEDKEQQRAAKLADLRSAIDEGLNSGHPISADAVFTELEQRYSGK